MKKIRNRTILLIILAFFMTFAQPIQAKNVERKRTKNNQKDNSSQKYDVLLDFDFYDNWFLSRYDVDVYFDNKKIETLKHGVPYFKLMKKTSKGDHILKFECKDNNVVEKVNVNIKSKTRISCEINTHSDAIELKNFSVNKVTSKQLYEMPYVIGMEESEAIEKLKYFGFNNVKKEEGESVSLFSTNVIISQEVKNAKKISKDSKIVLKVADNDIIDFESKTPLKYQEVLYYANKYLNQKPLSKGRLKEMLMDSYGTNFPKEEVKYAMEHIKTNWKKNALKVAQEYCDNNYYSKRRVQKVLISNDKYTRAQTKYAINNVKTNWRKNALKRAQYYSDEYYYSKKYINKKLVDTSFGDMFTKKQAEYAIKHVDANWRENALKTAQYYSDNYHYSKKYMFKELSDSKDGDMFTKEQARYAVNNIDVNWKENALKTAQYYSDDYHYSKKYMFKELSDSEDGDMFTKEQAQYAVNNIDVNWKENALEKAQFYSDDFHYSKKYIIKKLSASKNGDMFTKQQAQYAANNVDAEWRENALERAQDYSDDFNYSKKKIYNMLISNKYGGMFTKKQAKYAVNNVDVNWKKNALNTAKDYYDFGWYSKNEVYNILLREHFTKEQAQYAIKRLK